MPTRQESDVRSRAGLPVLPHQRAHRAPVPAARSRRSWARSSSAGIEARVFDCTFSSPERAARRTRRLAPGRGRHLLDGEPDRRDAARRRAGARAPAGGPAGGRRAAAHGVPGPLSPPRRRGVPRRGRPELPRVLPRLPGARRHAAHLLDLDLTDYDGLFARAGGLAVDIRPCTTRRRRSPAFPSPTAVTSTTRAYQAAWRDGGTGRPLWWSRWAAPTPATSAPSPCSATRCVRRDLDTVMEESPDCVRLGLRRPVDRRRHLHAGRCRTWRSSAGESPARHDVELPVARRQGHPVMAARMRAAGCRASTWAWSPAASGRSTS